MVIRKEKTNQKIESSQVKDPVPQDEDVTGETAAQIPEKIINMILEEFNGGADPCKLAGKYGISTKDIAAWQEERQKAALQSSSSTISSPSTEKSSSRMTGRYSKEFKEEVLTQTNSGRQCTEVAQQYNIPVSNIYTWRKKAKKAGGQLPEPKSTKPPSNASPINEEHRQLVLDLKNKHITMGPAQIQNHMKRFYAIKMSRHMIGRIFKDAGIPLQKSAKKDTTPDPSENRFEMSRPNELWAVDFKDFWIHSEKVYALFILDDYSRFCVGFALTRNPTADLAIETVHTAIQRYGRPERILSDRGPQFHAWNGVSRFSDFLGEYLTDHTVTKARHCFTNGKIEAFNKTIQEDLLDVKEMADIEETKKEISNFLNTYNFFRTHMGIDGLVPADRYFGMVAEARKALLEGLKKSGPGLKWLSGIVSQEGPAFRLPTLFQLLVHDGKMELVALGQRFKLGQAE
jgi:putative transposase